MSEEPKLNIVGELAALWSDVAEWRQKAVKDGTLPEQDKSDENGLQVSFCVSSNGMT